MNYQRLLLACLSCLFGTSIFAQPSSFSIEKKALILAQIEEMNELDQRHRSVISLGTMDEEILAIDAAMSDTATLETYVAFLKTVEKDLTKAQIDSLWQLQHELDDQNYQSFINLVTEYGYPSPERLGIAEDKLFAILLHPPIQVEPGSYLKQMSELLLPEVKAGHLKAKSYASFYDNILHKVMGRPQLYGTGSTFNPKTMQVEPPTIGSLEVANAARQKLGLKILEKGEYQLTDK